MGKTASSKYALSAETIRNLETTLKADFHDLMNRDAEAIDQHIEKNIIHKKLKHIQGGIGPLIPRGNPLLYFGRFIEAKDIEKYL